MYTRKLQENETQRYFIWTHTFLYSHLGSPVCLTYFCLLSQLPFPFIPIYFTSLPNFILPSSKTILHSVSNSS
ncbi:hypothetical protein BCR42DRAFT_425195 [Absidia repens]|uniref:Uncharacterized protein n=1 Tax=Absidia repens TaxID=90262 RepID=A0A1X2I2J6_9FUNG|nr:hypothetical protein BCR42DRAFT_425195 [Absidia repens]